MTLLTSILLGLLACGPTPAIHVANDGRHTGRSRCWQF
jgi:hypothetical protein